MCAVSAIESETAAELFGRLRAACSGETELSLPIRTAPIGRKQVIELAGAENSGKSQSLLTAVARCILPKSVGGLGLGAVYVDSDNKLSDWRLVNILEENLSDRLDDLEGFAQSEARDRRLEVLMEQSLRRFYCVRLSSFSEFLHCFDHLDRLLIRDPSIFLLCIDSISAFHWLIRDPNAPSEVAAARQSQQKLVCRFSQFIAENSLAVLASRLALIWRKRSEDGELEPFVKNVMDQCWQNLVSESVHLEKCKIDTAVRASTKTSSRLLKITDIGVIPFESVD